MTVRDRRARERDGTRARIMDAARRMFAAEGFDAVSMRRIAEAIEYSPTAIYVHFKDKDALFRAICDEDFLALASVFGQAAQAADPVDRIRLTGQAYARFALEHPNHYRLMFMTGKRLEPDAAGAARQGNVEEDAYAFLRELCVQAIAAGRFRPEFHDPDLSAQTFWSGIHGVVSLQISKAEDPWLDWRPVARRVDAMLDVLLRGICLTDPGKATTTRTRTTPTARTKKRGAR